MDFPNRKATRIPGFDYSRTNYYFVTICTHDKACIFGKPERLSQLGEIARADLQILDQRYKGIRIEPFVVMPNHVHMIVITEPGNVVPLTEIIGAYKSGVSRKIHKLQPDLKVWQRSFHDHVIRNQEAYEKIWNYIQHNPQKWEEDCFHPTNTHGRGGS